MVQTSKRSQVLPKKTFGSTIMWMRTFAVCEWFVIIILRERFESVLWATINYEKVNSVSIAYKEKSSANISTHYYANYQ